jgi:glutamyl-tRNA reductase
VSLRTKAEKITQAEMGKASNWMQKFDQEEQEKIKILVNSIVNKILHTPVSVLKEESSEVGSADIVATVRQIFRLDE